MLLLRAEGATGRLVPELRTALGREPSLLGRMARVLLDLHFPPSLHGELCEAVGLELELAVTEPRTARRRRRERQMREAVLTAYEYQCAFCGYDGWIGALPVGLEAACADGHSMARTPSATGCACARCTTSCSTRVFPVSATATGSWSPRPSWGAAQTHASTWSRSRAAR